MLSLTKNLITCLGCLIFVQAILSFEIKKYEDHNSAKIESIHISACPDAEGEHCVITVGSTISYKIAFETVKPFSRAILQVGAREGDQFNDHSFSLACDYLGLKCPSEAGQKQVLTHSTEIYESIPTGVSHYRLSLYDEIKNIIFSIQFPVKIVHG